MAYLGNSPVLSQQEYRNIDNISGSFNGVTTSFPLLVNGVAPVPAPQSSNQCLISVNGVVQKPDDTGASGFRLSGGNIVFSAAPTGGQSFFGVILAGADYVYSGSNFPDGTVSAPSITFAQDLDTGFYRSGAGEVKFTANGANVVTLSANNLTAPSFIPTSSTVPTNGVYLPSANNVAISTNGTGRLFVDSSGRILFGTSTHSGNTRVVVSGRSDGNAGGTLVLESTSSSPANGDTLGNLRYGTSGNTASLAAAAIGAERDGGTWTNNSSMPARLVFSTTADGASSPTERLRITSDGKVGLGTSSPSYKFHLARTDAAGDYAYMGASSDNGARGLIFSSADASGGFLGAIHRIRASSGSGELRLGTSSSDALTIDSSQRVGIGTTSASTKLHVYDGAGGGASLLSQYDVLTVENDDSCVIQIVSPTNKEGQIHFSDNSRARGQISYDHSSDAMNFNTAGNERARIDSSGRLGVGTSSPGATLVTKGAGVSDVAFAIEHAWGSSSTALFTASTSAGELMRLQRDGKLLVGTSSAGGNELLQIQGVSGSSAAPGGLALKRSSVGNTDDIGFINFQNGSGNTFSQIKAFCDGTPGASDYPGALTFSVTADGASSPTERMRLHSSGTFTLWGTNNNYQIHISGNGSRYVDHDVSSSEGDGFTYIRYLQAGSVRGSVTRSSTGVNFNNTSDYRAKENVIPLAGATDRIKKLKPSRFNFIEAPDVTVDGFIAHEAQAVVPEAVVGTKDEVDADGNPIYQGIDQSKLVPLLTAALQEALAEIESLKARVTALEP